MLVNREGFRQMQQTTGAVDQGTLARWERGEREPRGGFLERRIEQARRDAPPVHRNLGER